jgi:Tfp pilus assembly protein PilO
MSRIYFAIAFLAAALIVGGILAWPKYQALTNLNEGIEVKELELRSKTDYFDHIRKLSERLEEYQESIDKINSALPNDPLLPSTFNYLQNAASQAGLIMEEVAVGAAGTFGDQPQPATAPGKSSIKTINITVSLAGSYASLKNFLSEIENSSRIIEVKRVSFTSPEEEDEPFSFNINLVTYNN